MENKEAGAASQEPSLIQSSTIRKAAPTRIVRNIKVGIRAVEIPHEAEVAEEAAHAAGAQEAARAAGAPEVAHVAPGVREVAVAVAVVIPEAREVQAPVPSIDGKSIEALTVC
jgi:hypothetical protein